MHGKGSEGWVGAGEVILASYSLVKVLAIALVLGVVVGFMLWLPS